MQVSRRAFLETLAILPVAAGTPMAHIFAQTIGAGDGTNPKDQLSALMMGADLSSSGRTAGETLLNLARIYRLTMAGQPFDQGVRDEITQIAKEGVAIDASIFTDLDLLLQLPSAPDQARLWTNTIGAGLQSGAAFGSLMAPEASATLGALEIIAAPGLKYVATTGLNLAESPFPPNNVTPIGDIAALALDKMMAVVDRNPSLAAHLDSLKGDLGIDLSVAARTEAVSRLPNDIQAAISGSAQTTPDQKAKVKKAVAAVVEGSLSGFIASAPQVPTVAPGTPAPAPSAPPAAAPKASNLSPAEIKAQVEAGKADAQGAIAVGTFIIGRVLGDEAGAKDFGTAASAVLTAAIAFALFPAAMSPLAFAGSIAGAANTLIGLFGGGGGDPAAAALARSLALISKQLAKMQQQLDQLEALDRQILQGIKQILSTLESNQAQTTQNIVALGQLVQRGFSDQMLSRRQEAAKPVNDAITTVRKMAGDQPARPKDQWLDSYREAGTDKFFLPFATDTATNVFFTGNPSLSLKEVAAYLAPLGRVDLAMSLLPTICDGLGIPYRNQIHTARNYGPTYPIANPMGWGLGVEVYLESLRMVQAAAGNLIARDRLGTITNEQLLKLWTEGLVIREAVIVSTNSASILAAAATYRKATTGLVSSLTGALRTEADGFPFQKTFTVRSANSAFHQAPFQYVVGPPLNCSGGGRGSRIHCTQKTAFEIDNDPLDFAISPQNQLAHLEEIPALGNSLNDIQGHSYRIVIDVGPKMGPFLFNGTEVALQEYTSPTGLQRAFVNRADLNPATPPWYKFSYNFLTFQPFEAPLREFEKLIREYYRLDDYKKQFGTFCRTNLNSLSANNDDPVQIFFAVARGAQFVATVANWRRTPGNLGGAFPTQGTPNVFRIESLPIANLNNAPCISSVDDVMSVVDATLKLYTPDVAATMRIDDHVISKLKDNLEDSAKLIEKFAAGADPNGSLDIVDGGLQRIAGYWLSQGVKPPPVPYVPET